MNTVYTSDSFVFHAHCHHHPHSTQGKPPTSYSQRLKSLHAMNSKIQPSNTQPSHTQATIPNNAPTSSFHLSPTPILTRKLELHGCLFRSRAAPPPISQTRESYCFLKRSMMRNWNRERCPFISFDRSSSKSDGRVGISASL